MMSPERVQGILKKVPIAPRGSLMARADGAKFATPMAERPPIVIVDTHDELRSSLEHALRNVYQGVVTRNAHQTSDHETNTIYIEIPSDLEFLEPVTGYLIKRIEQAWAVPADGCANVSIALSESLINAIKHGNNCDPAKLVRITTELSNSEARFTVEDEGLGFDLEKVPHPRDPANLLKSSGRGVLFIQSTMDDVRYNASGNRLLMIKRRANLLSDEPLNSPTAGDENAR